jgi:hypothetical protein
MIYPPIWTASPEPGSSSLVGIFSSTLNLYAEKLKAPLSLSWPSGRPLNQTGNSDAIVIVCTISAHCNTGETQVVEKDASTELSVVTSALSKPLNPRHITLDVSDVDTIKSPEFIRDLLPTNLYHESALALSGLLVLEILGTPAAQLSLELQITGGRPPDYDEREMSLIKYVTVVWGSGYANRSTSVRLAMTVIITYCVINIAYLAYILITGSTSTA